jgi:hypothetical protein
MPRGFCQRGSVRTVDASNLAEQRPAVFIDDHHAILPGDKQTVIGWIGHEVVPSPVPAQRVGVGDAVRRGSLREQ